MHTSSTHSTHENQTNVSARITCVIFDQLNYIKTYLQAKLQYTPAHYTCRPPWQQPTATMKHADQCHIYGKDWSWNIIPKKAIQIIVLSLVPLRSTETKTHTGWGHRSLSWAQYIFVWGSGLGPNIVNEVLMNVVVVEFGPNLSCFLLVTVWLWQLFTHCWILHVGHDGLCHCVS